MSWHAFDRGGARLHGLDRGAGLPVVFQHGLGGSEAQVAEGFPDRDDLRRLTLDCRGQGRSPGGDPADYSIAGFADDVLGFAEHRGVARFVVGGISMGAAVALRIAVLHPDRIEGLVLARPAWLWDAAPPNLRPYAEVAGRLRDPDPARALAAFEASPTARRLAAEAPDNLASLRRLLAAQNRQGMADLLAAIAADGPGVTEAQVRSIGVPTLVIGHGVDAAHPLAFARTLASTIPGARFAEITPKATDHPRHVQEFRAALSDFLTRLPQ